MSARDSLGIPETLAIDQPQGTKNCWAQKTVWSDALSSFTYSKAKLING